MGNALRRDYFSISRAAEYFRREELQAQTGATASEFGHVVLKELIDNGLDAAEMVGRAPVIQVRALETPGEIILCVADNGDGIPDHVVDRLLDFLTRTSSKEAYRSPTRGAMGNATKTILGIPIALGASDTRLLIEGAGSRHEIKLCVNPAGDLDVSHDRQDGPDGGARITIAIPRACNWNPKSWIEGFALFNPHASLALTTFVQKSEVPGDWIKRAQSPDALFEDGTKIEHLSFEPTGNPKKYNESDATPAHWYRPEEFDRLAYFKRRHDPDVTVRAFALEFKGASRKAGEIAAGFPRLLIDADAKRLHAALLEATDAPRAETLGRVGKEHLKGALGGRRFWYEHQFGVADGLPFLIECGIAETEGPQRRAFALNYSTTLSQDPIRADSLVSYSGVSAFLDRELSEAPIAIAFHLVMPRLPSLDRGKSRIGLPEAVLRAALDVVKGAAKTLLVEAEKRRRRELKERERQEKQEAAEHRRYLAEIRRLEEEELRDEDRAERERQRRLRAEMAAEREAERLARGEKLTKREAMFSVLSEAYEIATDRGTLYVTARDLYYALRPLYERIDVRETKNGRDLDYNYFSSEIRKYRKDKEPDPLPRIDYKAKGTLYLPRSGKELAIGEAELRTIVIPEYEFNKILFIEKNGIWQTLRQTGGVELCKRHDMAVLTGEGYTSTAMKQLLSLLSNRGVTIYVWHDADPPGYNIVRKIREGAGETIEVIDLGMTVADALAEGLQVETYTRERAFAKELIPLLIDEELEFFTGEALENGTWLSRRIEINAIPPRDRVPWLEKRLPPIVETDEDGEIIGTSKLIPSPDVFAEVAADAMADSLRELIQEEIKRQIRIPEIVARAEVRLTFEPISYEEATAILAENPDMSWTEVADGELPSDFEIAEAVRSAIAETLGN
jgi:hypothetical protein